MKVKKLSVKSNWVNEVTDLEMYSVAEFCSAALLEEDHEDTQQKPG